MPDETGGNADPLSEGCELLFTKAFVAFSLLLSTPLQLVNDEVAMHKRIKRPRFAISSFIGYLETATCRLDDYLTNNDTKYRGNYHLPRLQVRKWTTLAAYLCTKLFLG